GIGNYRGSRTVYFNINPKGTSIRKLTAAKRKVTVTWNRQRVQTSGYQIQYSTNKKFTSNVKTISIGYNTTASRRITGLRSGKYYYFRVRTYKYIGKNSSGKSQYVYSGWSTVKYVKVK
ncbi:MAG: fibronectin type III domain-containing protein, partial [Mogibacterium sp.]|nr:fibronectin type III domain-containing protein [Mogibacterium sp.]